MNKPFEVKDMKALYDLFPPRGSEPLRKYILRAMVAKVITKTEGMTIKEQNPVTWKLA
jgi:hypothetical protein